jgi:hypothetical protein
MNQYFEARRANAVRLLAEKGVPRWKAVPAFYRFVWSLDIRLRPPHFASWETNFALFGITPGGLLAVVSWLAMTAVGREMALLQSVVAGAVVAVVNGFSAAARHKREAEDHALPRWDELPDVADVSTSSPSAPTSPR